MKKYNDLEELLVDFSMDLLYMAEGKIPIDSERLVKKYCKANSLALGKSETLEKKNKQTERIVEYHNNCQECENTFWTKNAFASVCDDCINNPKDATSQ